MKALIYIFCIVSLFCLKSNSAVGATRYPTLVQDSVYTRIEAGKAITTFKVTAPTSGNYILQFWLMGVKHINETYSSYAMRIDDNPVSDSITTDRGDWHIYGPDNSTLTFFSQGQHEIHLEGTLSDVPNAERVITRRSLYSAPGVMDENTRYAKMKNHQSYNNYVAYFESPLETDYRIINFNSGTDTTNAPFFYNAELNKEVYYTFFRLEYFTEGQSISITTDEVDGVGHVLNLFSKTNPYYYTWADSTYNGHANISLTIPMTDFYYVMVRSQSADEYGICNLTINGDKRFESVPICNSYTPFQNIHFGPIYSCFTKSDFGDPMIFIVGSDGKVYNFNDDYPLYPSSSDYMWGTNARIIGTLFSNEWLFTTAKSYPPEVKQRFDIYVGCESVYDNKIYSSTGTFSYNCIGWSIGSWTTWINPYSTIGEFDSLYALYGYEPTTNSNSSNIDLWKRNDVFSHASIKSKANPYAAGFDWESKDGAGPRFFHSRYSTNYGQVTRYYKKSYSGPFRHSIMNFIFTQHEMKQVEDGINRISNTTKDSFNAYLLECCRDSFLIRCSNTKDFPSYDSYRKLLDYCLKTPSTHYLLYKGISERNVLSVKVLQDITEKENPMIMVEIEKQLERLNKDGNSVKAIRNVQADGMLLAKVLLSGTSDAKDMIELVEKNVSFCNNTFLDVSVHEKKLDISFDLECDAIASVIVGSPVGSQIKMIADHKTFLQGRNHLYYTVSQPGIYTVSLLLNGGVFEKKIYMK